MVELISVPYNDITVSNLGYELGCNMENTASGDLPQPINLESGQEFTFTIQRGVVKTDCVSVNYYAFVNDVEAGGMMSFLVKSKTEDSVKCEVVDGGELKSMRHLNVRGKSATLPSITG
ncbi:hypothetical protein LWI29_018234 [Acer saccharum]|uniref:Uncharacterized protein n=1 Tax=Acer saccharum TaxID=4024 RepID=A0AA39SU72_ACESA|nr:hypothetical protein LWI29_018234 [Acer saccharum]